MINPLPSGQNNIKNGSLKSLGITIPQSGNYLGKKLDKNSSQQTIQYESSSNNLLEQLDLIKRTLTVQSVLKPTIQIPVSNLKILKPVTMQDDRIASAHHNQQLIQQLSGPIRPTSSNFFGGHGPLSEKFYIPKNIEENIQDDTQDQAAQFFNLNNQTELKTSFVMTKPQTAVNNPRRQNLMDDGNGQSNNGIQFNTMNYIIDSDKPQTAAATTATGGMNSRQQMKLNKNKSDFNNQAFNYLNNVKDFRDIVQQRQLQIDTANNFNRTQTLGSFQKFNQFNEGFGSSDQEDRDNSREIAQRIRERIDNNEFQIYTVNQDVRSHMKKHLIRPPSQASGLLPSQMMNSMRPTTSHTATTFSPNHRFDSNSRGGNGNGDKSHRTTNTNNNNYFQNTTNFQGSQMLGSGVMLPPQPIHLHTRSSQGPRGNKQANIKRLQNQRRSDGVPTQQLNSQNQSLKQQQEEMYELQEEQDFERTTQQPKSSNFPTRAGMQVQSELESQDYQNFQKLPQNASQSSGISKAGGYKDTITSQNDINFASTLTHNETDTQNDTNEHAMMSNPSLGNQEFNSVGESKFGFGDTLSPQGVNFREANNNSVGGLAPSAMKKRDSAGNIQKVGSVKFDIRIQTNAMNLPQGSQNNQSKHQNNNSMPVEAFDNQISINKESNRDQIHIVQNINNTIVQEEAPITLDINRDELTKIEYEYILKKYKEIAQDLTPYIQQNMRDFMDKIQQSNQIQLNEDDFQTQTKHLEEIDDVRITQEPNIIGQVYKGFFSNVQQEELECEINQNFTELNKQFERYQIQDEKERQKHKIEKEFSDTKFLSPDQNSRRVTEKQMRYIQEQFQLTQSERNYDMLDEIVQQLEFFSKYSQNTRTYLLRLAQLELFKPNTTIFNQGDDGELMYVIIRGGCHVRIKRVTNDGREENPVIVSIYDGIQFGELAFMSKPPITKGLAAIKKVTSFEDFKRAAEEQQILDQEEREKAQMEKEQIRAQQNEDIDVLLSKANSTAGQRAATIQSFEYSYILTIEREYFQNVILNLMKQELDGQLRLLITIPFFDYANSVPLIPLANVIETRVYSLGEIILKQGTSGEEFFIVSQGRCKIIKEEIITRNKMLMGQQQLKLKEPMKFGLRDFTHLQTNQGKPGSNERFQTQRNLELQAEIKQEIQEEMKKQPGHYEQVNEDREYIQYRYHHEMGNFVRGQFFMGRALLQLGIKIDPTIQDKINFNPEEPSRLTVIADAHQTEVFILRSNKLPLLAMELRNKIMDGIIMQGEFDHIYTNEINDWLRQWDKFKLDLIKTAMEQKDLKKIQQRR